MSQANVIAAIHPKDRGRLLVAVTDETGKPLVDLKAKEFSVLLWSCEWPPEPVVKVPVTSVVAPLDPIADLGLPAFNELQLGEVPMYGLPSAHNGPVASLTPHIYAIAFDRVIKTSRGSSEYHGVAIAHA